MSYLIGVKSKGVDLTSPFASPCFVNTVALVVPVLFTGATIGTGIATSNAWLQVIDLLDTILGDLRVAAESFAGTFTLSDLAPELAKFRKAEPVATALIRWLRIASAVLFAWGFLLLILSLHFFLK